MYIYRYSNHTRWEPCALDFVVYMCCIIKWIWSILVVFSLTSLYLIVSQSEVFAVAFALLAAGAVILTLNVLLLVITFFSVFMWSYFECQLCYVEGWWIWPLWKYNVMKKDKHLTLFTSLQNFRVDTLFSFRVWVCWVIACFLWMLVH